jgi:protein-S-isoprenylcysteine O-methyltransferase Ste14
MNLRYAASNLALALFFFAALALHARHYGGITDLVWMVGAALMGVFSLLRQPPIAATVNAQSISTTALMMILPLFMRAVASASGPRIMIGLGVEVFGVLVSEGARLYLGRRFGLLPANRGIVLTGPFAVVRHPIYSGWLILSLGYLVAYPLPVNMTLLAVTLPFMVWRINLEEELLRRDPAYRAYCDATRFRLLPLVY